MAKKAAKTEEVVEEVVEEKTNIIIDKHGFEWKVDAEGNKIERM